MAYSEDGAGDDRQVARRYIVRCAAAALSALAMSLFLSACVPPDPPQSAAAAGTVPRYATYRCDGNGEITLENFRTSVHVVDTRGVDVELPAAPANQTARYGQPGYALILERGTALWMVSGKRPVNCKRESDPA
jgi:hypothetical protein